MRKDKIENIIMRRVITWTMTVIIALSSIGGNFGVMTVYADELEQLVGKTYWPFPTYGELLFGVK